jgi:hypothetical protein
MVDARFLPALECPMISLTMSRCLPLVPALALTLASCAPAAKPAAKPAAAKPAAGHDHDHGDHAHPETLAEGVAELEKVVKDVADKLGSGAKDAADDAVHAVGHLLEDLEGLLEKQPLTADLKEAGKKALAELTDCFDKLDTALHAAEGEGETPAAVHATVAERIGAAVTALKTMLTGEGSTTEGK